MPLFSLGNQILDPKPILERGKVMQGAIVADLGCGGVGHFVFPASRMVGTGGHVYAVDILPSVLESINRRIREENVVNVSTVWSDLEIFRGAKDIADGALDVGMLLNTLFQSKKKEAMMRESVRMIKRGGILLVVEWKKSAASFGPALDLRLSEEETRRLAREAGLDESDAFQAGPYHYGMVFKKV